MFARMAFEINSNRYMFDSQEQELEILQTVTKEDFYKEFEAVFFNKHTVKRLDVSLVSTKHAEEQVEYITKNADQEIFKEYVVERVRSPAGTTIEDFKKDKATYDDYFKLDYEKFVSK
jgi:secreted Zn-dependent insulinase-like peptidase